MVTLAAPFVILLLASILRDGKFQRPVWLAAAILALALAAMTIFSVGILYFMIGFALLWAWWGTRGERATTREKMPALLTIWIAATLGIALMALSFRQTAMCWQTDEPWSGWSASPASISELCVSDIIDNTEATLALACVAICVAGIGLITRNWKSGALSLER